MKALQWDERLQRWCGQLERTRGGEPSDKGDNLSHVQAHVFTIQYAQKHVTTDKYAQSLLERLAAEKQRRLSREKQKGLKGGYELCILKVLHNAKIFRMRRSELRSEGSWDQESPMIIFMLTKPSKNPVSVSFIADQQWFNVALSCAREILVIVGNRIVWESATIDKITKTIGKKTRFLVNFLSDVSKCDHTMAWYGEATSKRRNLSGPRNTSALTERFGNSF
ncbi:hypothetical protein ACMYSQ_004105 [Aspergillus niger]|nr:hypothetical protein AnigIFM63326_003568 [Aspergillus niger]